MYKRRTNIFVNLDFKLSPCDEYWYFGCGVLHGVQVKLFDDVWFPKRRQLIQPAHRVKPQNQNQNIEYFVYQKR